MRILIADDDAISQRILKTALVKWGHEVTVAHDGKEAWEILERPDRPQLTILDWMMPHVDGPGVCQKVREQSLEPYTYLLILTAKTCAADIIKGLEAGADDYLTKPINLEELKARLQTGLRILNLQRELIAAREAYQIQATHDALTGLWNRGAIIETLHRELSRTKREQQSIGIALADLDHFKKVNDTYGHAAGDCVLVEAARRMRATTRPYDAVGRYGGEEFLLILPNSDKHAAITQGERLRAAVERSPFDIGDGHTISVTLSMGIATSPGGNASDAETLLKDADAALYRAKAEGRNRLVVAQPGEPPRPLWLDPLTGRTGP